MTSADLKTRIAKAEEKITKKQVTITKKEALIVKKLALANAGDKWAGYDAENLEDDIKRIKKEIPEIQKTLDKYYQQLSGELKRESDYIKEVPWSMKQLENELTERWNEYDIKVRDTMKEAYQTLSYSEFRKQYGYTNSDFMYRTNEQIEAINRREAKALIIDLFYRIREITGEVTEWSGIYCSGGALNGIVIGKEGRAKVETIVAGGYNIQRLHIRVLVHGLN